jgi:aconitate hydratase
MLLDPFQSLATLYTPAENYTIYRLEALERAGLTSLEHLPFSIRILLESILRQVDNRQIREEDVLSLAAWQPHPIRQINIPFRPSRVIMQDFTGVPCLVDLASMRQALARLGEDPNFRQFARGSARCWDYSSG